MNLSRPTCRHRPSLGDGQFRSSLSALPAATSQHNARAGRVIEVHPDHDWLHLARRQAEETTSWTAGSICRTASWPIAARFWSGCGSHPRRWTHPGPPVLRLAGEPRPPKCVEALARLGGTGGRTGCGAGTAPSSNAARGRSTPMPSSTSSPASGSPPCWPPRRPACRSRCCSPGPYEPKASSTTSTNDSNIPSRSTSTTRPCRCCWPCPTTAPR